MAMGSNISREAGKPNTNILTVIGLIFLILGLVGIYTCTSTSWFRTEFEDDSEDYYYGDFGEDFEENMGNDEADDYYGGSARNALIGFVFVFLFGIIFILEGLKNSFSTRIINPLFKLSPTKDSALIRSIFIVVFLLILIVPVVFAMVGGARFIGFAHNWQISVEATEYIPAEEIDVSFSTTAGYWVLGLGIFILMICLLFIIKEFPNIRSGDDLNESRYNHTKKLNKFALLILLISIISLVSIPLLPFLTLEEKYEGIEYEWNTDDGTRTESKLDSDVGIISGALTLILLFAIASFFGMIFYRLNRFPRGSHLMMFLGSFIIILALIGIIGFGLLAQDVTALDKDLEKDINRDFLDMDSPDNWKKEGHVSLGTNFVPVIGSGIIFVFGLMYSKIFWPVSIAPVLGERRASKTANYLTRPNAQKGLLAVIFMALIVIIASSGYYGYKSSVKVDLKEKELVVLLQYADLEKQSMSDLMSGYADEYNDEYYSYPVNESCFVDRVVLTLEWIDEPDETMRHKNEPDEFALMLRSPEDQFFESPWVQNDESSKRGMIELDTGIIDPPVAWQYRDFSGFENEWIINLMCGEAGDHQATGPSFFMFNDNGNDWDLTIEISYYYLENSE
jgi:sterol desaturase/sphingolipid hydroxylase (fatty acid hydroxylase superfamily)